MKTYKISVTKEDIEKGNKTKIDTCPIALALSRSLKKQCWTGLTDLFAGDTIIKTPEGVNIFMVNFDFGRKVKPFSFTIKI